MGRMIMEIITESESGSGQKGPQWVIKSNLPVQGG